MIVDSTPYRTKRYGDNARIERVVDSGAKSACIHPTS